MSDRHICRAKRIDSREWVEGNFITNERDSTKAYIGYLFDVRNGVIEDFDIVEVIPSTVCQCTGLPDKNGKKLWENDVYKWTDTAWGICTGIVKFGRYEQDGSGGEYRSTECIGWYMQVVKVELFDFTGETQAEAESNYPSYMRTFSLLQLLEMEHEYLGNIFDNPELLEGGAK